MRGLERVLAEIGPRRVVVLSDRYPPDAAGGAELSLHILLREPALRGEVLVVTFDRSLAEPVRRDLDGVAVIALPANAAWPLHGLSQAAVDAAKRRRFGMKWLTFVRETVRNAVRDPKTHLPAIVLQLAGPPPGGVRMAHATVPEGRSHAEIQFIFERVRPALVHADNARAILHAADVLKDAPTPLLAFVRDHRFTSLRFDQSQGPAESRGRTRRARLAAACAGRALAFRQACLRRADRVVVSSDHLAGTLKGRVAEEALTKRPLEPIDPTAMVAEPANHGKDFRILLVGSLTQNKGQLHLIEAWPDIIARIPDVRIEIAGRGAQRVEIERLVATFGAGDRITLHGHLDHAALGALYRDCDVVALPTLWSEPFGRVPLEAGAAGRPVVAYAAGGIGENVLDGVTGRLVRRNDRAGFVTALAELASDPEARARMGEAGRARAAAFAPEKLAPELLALWDETVAAAGRRGR